MHNLQYLFPGVCERPICSKKASPYSSNSKTLSTSEQPRLSRNSTVAASPSVSSLKVSYTPLHMTALMVFAVAPCFFIISSKPKYGDGIEWKLKQDVDFLRDA
jgi:hypothetical protein